jgi:predicted RNA binding protein YcfA (HicA-like mRNA interferase family)
MPKLPALKPSQVVRALEDAGFVRVRQRGSHLRLKRGNLAVTVPMHSKDLPTGVLRSILRQAQLTEEEFFSLLKGST